MTSKIIASTRAQQEQAEQILDTAFPLYRQAYSDRTAWLMACLSELAYIRFNPFTPSKFTEDRLEDMVNQLSRNKADPRIGKLLSLLNNLVYDHQAEEATLKNELRLLNSARLIDTFDEDGTQAILVELEQYHVLAFRGTEATSLEDIKTDIRAITTECVSGGQVHTGFKQAYEAVESQIERSLHQLDNSKPLMITGHSLGGALAMVAAKRLGFKNGIAACYTFGAPRVGNEEWISSIKTPIYRIVNAADAVTMLPPNKITIGGLSTILGILPYVGRWLQKKLLEKFNGYIHGGNMRYLTNCDAGKYEEVRLLYSVSFAYRLKAWFLGNFKYNKFLADHSISIYRKKLAIIAVKRNPARAVKLPEVA